MALYKFGEIAFNSTEKKKPVESDKSVYIGLEHLDSRDLRVNRWGSDVAPIGDKLIMKKGDVLFGKRRAYQKKVAIAPFDGIFSAHGLVLRPKEDVIDKEFFPFFISSDYFLDAAIKISVGSLSPTINWGDLKELEFDLPSMEEQKRLAKILMATEETRQAYKKLIKQTDDLVKAKFTEMFKNVKNVKKLTEISTPKQWKTIASKDLSDSGYPVYGANGIIGYTDTYNHEFPTILITCRGATCGEINVSKPRSYVNGNAMCLDNLDSSLRLEYMEYFCKNYDFKPIISGSAQPQITIEGLSRVDVSVPDIEEQDKFIEFVQKAEQTKLATQQSLDALNETVRALVNRNFN